MKDYLCEFHNFASPLEQQFARVTAKSVTQAIKLVEQSFIRKVHAVKEITNDDLKLVWELGCKCKTGSKRGDLNKL